MFDILNIKSSFFDENEMWLHESKRVFAIYKQQPQRKHCKLCGSNLPGEKLFTSLDVDFYLCDNCGHLNGGHQETKEFIDAAYSGVGLGKFYQEPSLTQYISRMEAVYIPKALFLTDSLQTLNVDYKKMKFLDVGCGSGYMVGALRRLGLNATGIDVSEYQVSYGNKMLDTGGASSIRA
jgi:SAM-dependent methyltransferase